MPEKKIWPFLTFLDTVVEKRQKWGICAQERIHAIFGRFQEFLSLEVKVV